MILLPPRGPLILPSLSLLSKTAAPSPPDASRPSTSTATPPPPVFPPTFPCDPIDEADRGDALACVDYVGDIMDALFESEVRGYGERGE